MEASRSVTKLFFLFLCSLALGRATVLTPIKSGAVTYPPAISSGTWQIWADTINSAITVDGSGNVTKVTDLSGRGFDLSPGTSLDGKTSGNVPLVTSAINGKTALHFGTNWLQTAANWGANVSGNPSATIFVVAKQNTTSVSGGLAGWGDSLSGAGHSAFGVFSDSGHAGTELAFGGAMEDYFTNGNNLSAQIIVISKTPGTIDSSATAWLNETSNPLASTTSTAVPTVDGTKPFSWGIWSNYAGTNGLIDHYGGAVAVATPALSDSDRLAVTRALNTLFGGIY